MFSSNVEPDENAPIKFSTSKASKRRVAPIVKYTPTQSAPWYQPFSVVGSVALFLIYFCLLREENDMDREFDKTLYDRIKGLEKAQLLQSYKYNKEHGKSVADIEKRLKEIEADEAKLAM